MKAVKMDSKVARAMRIAMKAGAIPTPQPEYNLRPSIIARAVNWACQEVGRQHNQTNPVQA